VTQTSSRSSHDIHTDVCAELRGITEIDTHIQVTVHSGIVTLSGEVGSLTERLTAKRTAIRVVGVTAVADSLRVRPPGTVGADDAAIARTANEVLRTAADVPAGTVNAQVHDQVITLSGNVPSDHQRDTAVRAVMNIKGVTGVANTITLGEAYASTAGVPHAAHD
jgi:osmotically-inducible protein OsmY